MIEKLFGQYYGIDWLAMCGSLLFIYFVGNKKRYSFIIGIIANIAWIVVNFWAHVWAGVIVNIILTGLNVRGYIQWGKNNEEKK